MSTSQRRATPATADQSSSASAVRESSSLPSGEDDGTRDVIVARWLNKYNIQSSIVRELNAVKPLPLDELGELAEEPTAAAAQDQDTAAPDEAIPVAASPENVTFEEQIVFEGEEDVEEVKLSPDDVRRVLAEAQEEVQLEREEESKKRQKAREREEREETKAKKAKEVHEWLNSAPAGAAGYDIRLIQASLQEAEEARGPT
eukprot:4734016-Amphidinium_carterae.1